MARVASSLYESFTSSWHTAITMHDRAFSLQWCRVDFNFDNDLALAVAPKTARMVINLHLALPGLSHVFPFWFLNHDMGLREPTL